MPSQIAPPTTEEYSEYHSRYVRRVPQGDIIDILTEQITILQGMLNGLSDEQALFRPAPGEWSIKEVVGHLCDCERIFLVRAVAFSRNDPAAYPGFEQDHYVSQTDYDRRTLASLLEEWTHLRKATILAFADTTPEVSERRGVASDVTVSVRGQLYINAGHLISHLESFESDYKL